MKEMNVVNIIEKIKRIHVKDMVLVRIGKFYYAYGKDAYILSYLFGYKLNKVKGSIVLSCAFPVSSYSKVISELERKKINYIIVDRRNNYEVDEKSDNKNLNNYQKTYEKAHEYVNLKLRLDNIYTYILKNINDKEMKNKIRKIEEILNENREV